MNRDSSLHSSTPPLPSLLTYRIRNSLPPLPPPLLQTVIVPNLIPIKIINPTPTVITTKNVDGGGVDAGHVEGTGAGGEGGGD